MPNDKLAKTALDIQKWLRSPAYANAIEAASRVNKQMADAVRAFQNTSFIEQMIENARVHQELARAAMGPLWEMKRTGILDLDSPWRRQMELAQQAMEDFHARFRLPEITETARLLAEFKTSSVSETLARYAQETSSLQRAMENMRTPWLDAQERMRSIGGFAGILGIGHALRSMRTFDERLSAALRSDLGDWRDVITWRPEIFSDLTARSDFYVSLGFNPALTDFPPPAFEQSLDIAGLRSGVARSVRPHNVPPSANDDDGRGLVRTNAAHDRLQKLERLFRKFIDEQMAQAFGTDWPKHRMPNGLLEQWQEKKHKAEEAGAEERPLIEYADFTDYPLVICRGDNWREVFNPFFSRPESVRESFQRLHPIRLDIAHSRLITQDDELLLHVEATRLLKVIKKRRN